jgi:hypothetical protein
VLLFQGIPLLLLLLMLLSLLPTQWLLPGSPAHFC